MIAYLLHSFAHREAPKGREWISNTPGKFAAYCLPMMIANELGHQLLTTGEVSATWGGGEASSDLQVSGPAQSIFGSGIVTFHSPAIFRTAEGIRLLVTGPLNEQKDGAAPLSGVVESDWMVATWTMNWKFTRPGTVTWAAGEPYCQMIEINPDLAAAPLAEQPMPDDLREQFQAWSEKRSRWGGTGRDLDYLHGTSPGGASAPAGAHMKRLRRR